MSKGDKTYIHVGNLQCEDDQVLKLLPNTKVICSGTYEYDQLPEDVKESPPDQAPDAIIEHIHSVDTSDFDFETLLFALRLFKPGEVLFLRLVRKPEAGGVQILYPYPVVFSHWFPGMSGLTYKLCQSELCTFKCLHCEVTRAVERAQSCSADENVAWLSFAKREFLFGSSIEFDERRQPDRLVHYMSALDAALVPEGEFIARLLSKRGAALVAEARSGGIRMRWREG